MRRALLLALGCVLLAGGLAGCADQGGRKPSEALFIGVDVSGSFSKSREEALEFLAYYLYGRLTEKSGLNPVSSLYVGSVGGEATGETKSFHPIEDFQGKTPDQILAELKTWFPRSDRFTDFNIFFRQMADIAQKRNLALRPIDAVILSDGLPDSPEAEGTVYTARFDQISMSPLEFLSRRVTVRLLFATPTVCHKWETVISRRRVRMWTVDDQVMAGWRSQLDASKPADQQDRVWNWIADNVDYRVRPAKMVAQKPGR